MINTASKNIPLALDFMRFVTSKENGQVLSAPPYRPAERHHRRRLPRRMNPSVVDGLKGSPVASYLMPWLDTANAPRVAAAWLSSLQALAGGSMSPSRSWTRSRRRPRPSK